MNDIRYLDEIKKEFAAEYEEKIEQPKFQVQLLIIFLMMNCKKN